MLSQKTEKVVGSTELLKNRVKPFAEFKIGHELKKISKNISKFGRFRPFAPYINT